MASIFTYEGLGIWVAAFFTVSILSFLFKENPLYRFAEHVVVGVSVGYGIVLSYYRIIVPYWYDKMIVKIAQGDLYGIGLIPAAMIGMLWLARLVPKYAWLSRYPIAIEVGFFSGYAIPITIQTTILVHIRATWANTIVRLADGSIDWFNTLLFGVIIFFGVITVLFYFFFSKAQVGVYGFFTQIGIWFLMVSFGASFGYTVMARISLFIGRLQFLLTDWLGLLH